MPSRGHLGAILGPTCEQKGAQDLFRSCLFSLWAQKPLKNHRFFNIFYMLPGACKGRLKAVLRHLGAILGPSWGNLGPRWGHPGAILGLPWGLLGPSWAFFGPLRTILGPSLGDLGAILRASWSLGGHFVASLGLFGAPWGLLRPSWGHLGAILGPS